MELFRNSKEKEIINSFELANHQPGHDAAVSTLDEDLLNRWPIAAAIYRSISASPQYSIRVGLYGPWGTGKTSVLNFLRNIAVANDDIVIHVSAWKAVDANSFINTLSREMESEIKIRRLKIPFKYKLKKLLRGSSQGVASIAEATGQVSGKMDGDLSQMITASAAFTGSIAKSVAEKLNLSTETVEKLRQFLKNHKVIIFVDDLDRADPKILPKTLMMLRDHLDWPGFSFILAFDKNIINIALQDYSAAFSAGQDSFLEKIVDIAHELKPPSAHTNANMVKRLLDHYCDFIPHEAKERSSVWFPDNPRKTKSIIRELSELRSAATRHAPGELKWEAIIVHTILRREPENFVNLVEQTLLGKGKQSLGMSFNENKGDAAALLVEAMSATMYQENSIEYKRTYNLIVRLQGLRAFQEEKEISYEMSLGTHEPTYTKKELRELIELWSINGSDEYIQSSLRASSERSFTGLREACSILIEMTLEQYRSYNIQLQDPKEKTTRRSLLSSTQKTAEFLFNLAQQGDSLLLKSAPNNIKLCLQALDIFIDLSHFNNIDEDYLRLLEPKILRLMIDNCTDKVELYHSCTKLGPQDIRSPLVEFVRDLTVNDAINSTLQLFTEVNGIYLSSLTEDGKKHFLLLSDSDSELYKEPYKSRLIQIASRPYSEEESWTLAKNCKDYLNYISNKMGGFSYFAKKHLDIILTLWSAIIREEWTSEGINEVKGLKKLIENWGKVDNLPLPKKI